MTIFCDRDNRWYLGFLCGLLLLAVGLGAIFSWQLGQAAQAVLVAREETVAAVLLAEGVPETTVAKAFAEENGHSAAAAALLEKIGHDRATSPLLFPAAARSDGERLRCGAHRHAVYRCPRDRCCFLFCGGRSVDI